MKNQIQLKTLTIICVLSFLMLSAAIAHEWMAPKKEAARPNPLENNSQVMDAGQKIYSQLCIDCHGNDARGLSPDITGLAEYTPDLQKTSKTHSDGDLFWKIKTGRGEMPSFMQNLDEEEIWSIIHFINDIK